MAIAEMAMMAEVAVEVVCGEGGRWRCRHRCHWRYRVRVGGGVGGRGWWVSGVGAQWSGYGRVVVGTVVVGGVREGARRQRWQWEANEKRHFAHGPPARRTPSMGAP